LDLELAPGTVAKAYALLERTEVASTHRRRGTIIADRAALAPDARRRKVDEAASAFAQTVRLLNIDADTARAAIETALST
jgi:DNA-binding transcriptional regulator YhcF (GntR family)